MIDFHCHLDLYPDPAMVVQRCRDEGIYVLSVTTTPKAWRGTLRLAKDCKRIRTALGLHPQLAHERSSEMPLFEGLLAETKYVGEIGLDGTPEYKQHWQIQTLVFERVLKATSKAGGRIMSIHSRRAVDDVLDILSRHPNAGIPVLHWFSGTNRQLERAVSLGCWFSVGPAMLRGKRGAELASAMPKDKVLTETDGPFATGNNQALQPFDVKDAVSALAMLWGESVDMIRDRMRQSFRSLVSSVERED